MCLMKAKDLLVDELMGEVLSGEGGGEGGGDVLGGEPEEVSGLTARFFCHLGFSANWRAVEPS